MPVLAICRYSLFVYTSYYTLNYVATLLWITPAMQSLKQRVAPCLKFICRFDPSGSHLFYYVIKNIPSDAESREEQDGSKHKLVGGRTAKLWPNLCQGVMKNTEEK